MDKVGIFRTGADLHKAVDELAAARSAAATSRFRKEEPATPIPELVEAIRVPKMFKLALAVACGPWRARRAGGPRPRRTIPSETTAIGSSAPWLYWRNENDDACRYARVRRISTSSKMEMPPGSRGYGKDATDPPPRHRGPGRGDRGDQGVDARRGSIRDSAMRSCRTTCPRSTGVRTSA